MTYFPLIMRIAGQAQYGTPPPDVKKPAFRIDPAGDAPLSRQLAAAIRTAIVQGTYRPGDVLPPIRALAPASGSSAKVARRALELLAADGWTRPVRGIGSVVLDRGEDTLTNGRILVYVRQTGYSYYCAELLSVLDRRLLAKGYTVSVVSASGRSETPGCRRFGTRLREKWALVVLMDGGAEARRLADDSGRPLLLVGDSMPLPKTTAPSCIGRIGVRFGKVMPAFVRECVRAGVRSVVQFKYDPGAFDAAEMLAVAGIKSENVRIGRKSTPQAVALSAMAEMRRIAARRPLPDLFLFTDDYIAQGALLALAAAGIRVPEDVKVATHANKGLGPIWSKPLSRFEVDPAAHGRAIADAILRFLEAGDPPQNLELGSVWRKGETL